MTETCFQNHTDWVARHLQKANHNICIAMCWFSNPRIFQTILEKLQSGIRIELLIEFDDNNIRDGGLDFNRFIKLGGHLYASNDPTLMHHKFAVIDNRVLLTGSFNWTNNDNTENSIACDDPAAVQAFLQEHTRLKGQTIQLQNISDLVIKSSDSTTKPCITIGHEDLRKKIASGNKCWVLKLPKMQANDPDFFQQNHLFFDPNLLSQPYWTTNTQFSPTHFENWLNNQPTFSTIQTRYLNTWYRRIKPNDLIFPIGQKNELLGLGVIQPGLPAIKKYPYRPTSWVHIQIPPITMKGQYPTGAPVQYLNSGMQLLQTIFTQHP